MIRTALFLAALAAARSVHAADAGSAAESLAARIEQQATPLPYEAWTKTARVGDYIVRKFANGPSTRTEVRELDANFVYVDEVSENQGKKTERKRKYVRDENTQKAREVDMKSSGAFKQKVNGVKLNCEGFDGYIVTALKEWNGTTTAMKLARYHKVVAEGVPFGGVIRELQAPDDKIDVAAKPGGGFVKLLNTNETLQVVMEATAWGNSVDERKK